MRHEIIIGDVDKRTIEHLSAPLLKAPKLRIPSAYRGDGGEAVIVPNYIDATFVRTPETPVWLCTSVQVGGTKTASKGRERHHIYKDALGMPGWLALVLDELMKELPE